MHRHTFHFFSNLIKPALAEALLHIFQKPISVWYGRFMVWYGGLKNNKNEITLNAKAKIFHFFFHNLMKPTLPETLLNNFQKLISGSPFYNSLQPDYYHLSQRAWITRKSQELTSTK